MAAGVFGIPITADILRGTGSYVDPITPKDVASYAKMHMTDGGKDIAAQQFVDNLKSRHGKGVSTKCLIYNATGATLDFVTYKDWHGHINESPYPSNIQNGQWGAFLHVHPSGAAVGSARAVVYRSSGVCDWLFAWSLPYSGHNNVYTEIREEGHFPQHWDYIYNLVKKSGRNSSDSRYEFLSNTEIGEGTTVNARAVFEVPE